MVLMVFVVWEGLDEIILGGLGGHVGRGAPPRSNQTLPNHKNHKNHLFMYVFEI